MVTEADFHRRSPSTTDYRLQDILHRACRSTAQSSDSASVLELGKYNHRRGTYMLDVDESDNTQLMYTINDYRALLTMPAAEAPIDAELRAEAPLDAKSGAEALCHPDDSDNNLRRDIRATGMDSQWRISSEVAVRRIWKQFRRFLLSLCFLLFSSLFIFSLDLGPVQMASAWVCTTCQPRWSFPVHQIHRKVTIELYRLVVGHTGSYDCVH